MSIDKLEQILARCEEFGDCLLWTGGVTSNGYPTFNHALLRRRVRELVDGVAPKKPVTCSCGEKLCLRPEHLVERTHKQIGKEAAKRGAFSSPTRRLRISMTKRARHAKLTLEAVREIRVSDESTRALAKRHGVHRTMIQRIRSGKAWHEIAPGASVFTKQF